MTTYTKPARSDPDWDVEVSAAIDGINNHETRIVSLEGGTGGAVSGLVDIREFGTIVTSGSSDHYSVFAAAVAGAPEGSTIWIPPVPTGETYRLGQTLVISRHVNLAGSWTRDKDGPSGDVPYGSIIEPTDATAQGTMTAGMIRVQRSGVVVEGLFLAGHGQASGGSGLRFAGTDPGSGGRHSHGAAVRRVGVTEFQTGFVFGAWSDHASLHGCLAAGNRDGIAFEDDNNFDYYAEDCLFDGNVRASVFMPDGVGTDNFAMVRCHLGFSQYGIYQDDTSNSGNGFSGLTMIACPVEYVSIRHIELGTTGLLNIRGGYWTWNGTPTQACVKIRAVTHGPCWIEPRLDGGFVNANSPGLVDVYGFNNFPIHSETPLNDFTLTRFVDDSYIVPAGAPYAASFTPEIDYAYEQAMVCTGNVTVNIPTGGITNRPMDLSFLASGGTRTVTVASGIRTTAGTGSVPSVGRGAFSVPSGQLCLLRLEYYDAIGAWAVTRAQITVT